MASLDDQVASMIANLPAKTGRTLDEWLVIVSSSGLSKHGEIVKMLKGEHQMSHGFANLVSRFSIRSQSGPEEDPVAAQYAGAKQALRPLYEAICDYARSLGPDVEIAPKKTSVSIRRSKQFALVQAASKSRIDLGINLKGIEPLGRLEAWDGMISHRVRIERESDIDPQLKAWLKQAYERA
jgi:hypothetical protein